MITSHWIGIVVATVIAVALWIALDQWMKRRKPRPEPWECLPAWPKPPDWAPTPTVEIYKRRYVLGRWYLGRIPGAKARKLVRLDSTLSGQLVVEYEADGRTHRCEPETWHRWVSPQREEQEA